MERDGKGWKRMENDGKGWKRMENDLKGWKRMEKEGKGQKRKSKRMVQKEVFEIPKKKMKAMENVAKGRIGNGPGTLTKMRKCRNWMSKLQNVKCAI